MAGRVLILDDDADTRMLLAEILRLDGHECVLTDSIADAQGARPETFDVVLADNDLGSGPTGYAFLEQLLSTQALPASRLALCTAETLAPPDGVRYFQKPFRVKALRDFVQNVCHAASRGVHHCTT